MEKRTLNTIKNKHLNIGIYAHVDAGKTTLSEALLYLTGAIRSSGRVDHGDTFLDTYSLERTRGITIFSKQAELDFSENTHVTLLDTPGHADFAPETERTMKVLDVAVLVISAADGVTAQVRLLWRLLSHYKVPTFFFVNKMDQNGADRDAIFAELKEQLSPHTVDFSDIPENDCLSVNSENFRADDFQEELALCDDILLDNYLEKGEEIDEGVAADLITERKLFPCIFGSALKMEGVKELIFILDAFTNKKLYPDEFGARIYKISRDSSGNRLTWMKIMGGQLRPRDLLPVSDEEGKEDKATTEKVDQIRVYSGEKFELLNIAPAGRIVAVTGLSHTYAGQGLGSFKEEVPDLLQPVMSSRILLADDVDPFKVYNNLLTLSEEEPLLSVQKSEETGDISVQVMGQVQMEVLKHLCKERFSVDIDFGPGTILYKETIRNPVEGVGHFEPLRHYAEVHLLLTPGEPGSGLSFSCDCQTDVLARNWQNLILSHLEEFKIRGVLTGSDITDMKITVIGGRAHEKHTEGGDFREATMRAVRQGLMMAENVLLEPMYDYEISLPAENVGRALNDIQCMGGTSTPPEIAPNGFSVIKGTVPASELGDYPRDLLSYSHGQGQISLNLRGFEPCHNSEEVIAQKGYDPERDLAQPTGSVFCSHGAGTVIPWNEVRNHMHVDTGWGKKTAADNESDRYDTDLENYGDRLQSFRSHEVRNKKPLSYEERSKAYEATIQELDRIFEQTYGPVKLRYDAKADEERKKRAANIEQARKVKNYKPHTPEDSYLLVDGYNIIYANPELKSLANEDMKAARDKLMDILSNFQGYRREQVILVFDAYRVPGGSERVLKYHNLDVVFTREAETADQYIERTAHEYSKKSRVTVATSDAIEQVSIYGAGALRMSANDFWLEIKRTEEEIREKSLR